MATGSVTADFWRWRARWATTAVDAGDQRLRARRRRRRGFASVPTATTCSGRYRVGHGVGFTVDRCRNCEGAWLDGGEWEALRLRNLHDDLPRIFDDEWQRAVKREVQEQTTEENFRRRLGDADYAGAGAAHLARSRIRSAASCSPTSSSSTGGTSARDTAHHSGALSGSRRGCSVVLRAGARLAPARAIGTPCWCSCSPNRTPRCSRR